MANNDILKWLGDVLPSEWKPRASDVLNSLHSESFSSIGAIQQASVDLLRLCILDGKALPAGVISTLLRSSPTAPPPGPLGYGAGPSIEYIEHLEKRIKGLEASIVDDAISKISSTKFEAKRKAANLKIEYIFTGNIWEVKCNINKQYVWRPGSEPSQYELCKEFIREIILPDQLKHIPLKSESQKHIYKQLHITGTLGDISSTTTANNFFFFELKKQVLQTRELHQACLATLLVRFATGQEIVRAMFTDLKGLYAGLLLHGDKLVVTPFTQFTSVQDFIAKAFADGGDGEDDEGRKDNGRRKDDEGRKDEGRKDGRKDEGKKDEGRKDSGGTGRGIKRGGCNDGGETNKQQKLCKFFKTDFDLELVLEQTTSLPIEEQLDYFLKVCEPHLLEM